MRLKLLICNLRRQPFLCNLRRQPFEVALADYRQYRHSH